MTTRPTPQMGIESRFWVRVLLLDNVAECTIEVPSAFRITPAEAEPRIPTGGPAMEPLLEPAKISLVNGQLLLGTTPLAGKEAVLSPEPPIRTKRRRISHGRLKLIVNSDGRSLNAVNLVPLEPYLAGVVGEEMPQLLGATGPAGPSNSSRTYCLFAKNRFGTNRSLDVKRTQVRPGLRRHGHKLAEGLGRSEQHLWPSPDLTGTYGKQVVCPRTDRWRTSGDGVPKRDESRLEGAPKCETSHVGTPAQARPTCGIPGLFPAYYSSTCGGHTSSSEEVFGDSYGPLKGVECPYCKNVAKLEDFCWPMASFDRETVTKQLVDRYPKVAAWERSRT